MAGVIYQALPELHLRLRLHRIHRVHTRAGDEQFLDEGAQAENGLD